MDRRIIRYNLSSLFWPMVTVLFLELQEFDKISCLKHVIRIFLLTAISIVTSFKQYYELSISFCNSTNSIDQNEADRTYNLFFPFIPHIRVKIG